MTLEFDEYLLLINGRLFDNLSDFLQGEPRTIHMINHKVRWWSIKKPPNDGLGSVTAFPAGPCAPRHRSCGQFKLVGYELFVVSESMTQ